MKELPVVTIDGPAGVGKTTLAALLAQKLGIATLDTGAMFRMFALRAGPDSPDFSDERLMEIGEDLRFSLSGKGSQTILLCNGKPAGIEIKPESVGLLASALARRPVVREIILREERAIGHDSALVAEGRDMGTVVFPDAAFKFFLTATPHVRAVRRLRQYEEKGLKGNLAQIEKEIMERDAMDENRPIAPLKPAKDAVIIDTSNMDSTQTFETMLADIRANGGDKLFHMA